LNQIDRLDSSLFSDLKRMPIFPTKAEIYAVRGNSSPVSPGARLHPDDKTSFPKILADSDLTVVIYPFVRSDVACYLQIKCTLWTKIF
jgi:hypothetical protein